MVSSTAKTEVTNRTLAIVVRVPPITSAATTANVYSVHGEFIENLKFAKKDKQSAMTADWPSFELFDGLSYLLRLLCIFPASKHLPTHWRNVLGHKLTPLLAAYEKTFFFPSFLTYNELFLLYASTQNVHCTCVAHARRLLPPTSIEFFRNIQNCFH